MLGMGTTHIFQTTFVSEESCVIELLGLFALFRPAPAQDCLQNVVSGLSWPSVSGRMQTLGCSGDKIADDEGCPPEVQRVVKRVQRAVVLNDADLVKY